MKVIEDILLKRTSVRRYERKGIESEKINLIYEAIRNTPTSYNGQQFSVIAVTDQNLKEELYQITNQKQIKTCALFLVFCIDFNKIRQLSKAMNIDYVPFQNTIEGYTVGVVDAALAMQNATVAALSLGLGCCCIGYTRTASPEIISKILELPQGVCIVCGLTIGYPSEHPDLKPKEPQSLIIHENKYNSNVVDRLIEYDREISEYNKIRSGTTTDNDWANRIVDYYRHARHIDSIGYLKSQGFNLQIEEANK